MERETYHLFAIRYFLYQYSAASCKNKTPNALVNLISYRGGASWYSEFPSPSRQPVKSVPPFSATEPCKRSNEISKMPVGLRLPLATSMLPRILSPGNGPSYSLRKDYSRAVGLSRG